MTRFGKGLRRAAVVSGAALGLALGALGAGPAFAAHSPNAVAAHSVASHAVPSHPVNASQARPRHADRNAVPLRASGLRNFPIRREDSVQAACRDGAAIYSPYRQWAPVAYCGFDEVTVSCLAYTGGAYDWGYVTDPAQGDVSGWVYGANLWAPDWSTVPYC
jgi:hypothetical protein